MTWQELYVAHRELRRWGTDRLDNEWRRRIAALSKRGHCPPTSAPQVTRQTNREYGRTEVRVGGSGFIALDNLHAALAGRLFLHAMMCHRSRRIDSFVVCIEAKTRDTQCPFIVSVEMHEYGEDGRPYGPGACGHALVHCHVGPDHRSEPQVRVPFPPVGAVAALDWALTVVVPDWEPAPWNAIEAGPEE